MTTALPPAPGGPAPTAPTAEVARARIAVMVGSHQVDVVLPTKFSVETFIDDLIGVLSRAIGDENLDLAPPTGRWSLARPGETPIPRWRTLAEHGIDDGTVLMLCTVESDEVFTPVVEDITDALALINDREFSEFDPPTAAVSGLIAWCIGTTTAAVLLWWSWMQTADSLWYATPALVLGGLCWIGAVVVLRRFNSPRACLGLTMSAVPPLFAGGAMLVPPEFGEPGRIVAANAAAGAAIATVAAITMIRMTRLGVATLTALAGLGLLATIALIPPAFIALSADQVAAGIIMAGLVLLAFAPRLASAIAQIKPPDLPDPGNEVDRSTLNDIFDDETGTEPDADEDSRRRTSESVIERRARLAVTSLRGIVVAVSAITAAATVTVCAAAPGGIREIVMAGAVAGILVLRSRWFPDRVQAVAFVAAAALVVVGTATVLVRFYDYAPDRLAVLMVVLAIALGGAVSGTRLPGVRLSPVTRRVLDFAEYALLIVVPVIAFWVMGVYTAMRHL